MVTDEGKKCIYIYKQKLDHAKKQVVKILRQKVIGVIKWLKSAPAYV